MYDRAEEARMRLDNSIIRRQGEPLYISAVYLGGSTIDEFLGEMDEDVDTDSIDIDEFDGFRVPSDAIKLTGYTLKSGMMEEVFTHLGDPTLDFTPVPLGFTPQTFGVGNPGYMWRETTRQYKQGLAQRNLNQVRVSEQMGFRSTTWEVNSPMVFDTIRGKHASVPTVLDYLENISEEAYERQQVFPFHREYALSVSDFGQLFLWHRFDKIGISDDGEFFRVLPHFNHLKEDIEEQTQGVLKIASL